MTPPTIEQRCEAQKWANYSIIPSVDRTHLLTADELRRVLTELAMLRETVGVRGDSPTSQDDCAHWSKLMDRADRCVKAERQRDQWRECAREACDLLYKVPLLAFGARDSSVIDLHNARAAWIARFDALVKEDAT